MAGGQARSAEAAERYASALFELARDAKAVDATAADLTRFADLMASSADLRRVIANPVFSRDQKRDALTAVAEKAGLSDLARRFLGVAAANGRARDLAAAIRVFEKLAADHRGVTVAEVSSARPLEASETARLKAALEGAVGRGVELKADVKPELLGGLVVKVGSRMFDSSLKRKLEGLKTAMKGA